MELNNEIEVNASVGEVWEAFNTPEKIAPCLPGAELQKNEGEEFHGIVKIKVGPITTQYKGTATYIERDYQGKKIVIKGDGRDVRGAGNASALITANLVETSPTTTQVKVSTELTITGKVAQFGRGAITDVSAKLMTQFAKNLEELLEGTGNQQSVSQEDAEDNDSGTELNLLSVVAMPVLKRFAIPVIGAAVGIFYLIRDVIL
tara:strand:- start:968 stop:1579 length:612 start_codon:yes stop_codon:yes gene_type:complete